MKFYTLDYKTENNEEHLINLSLHDIEELYGMIVEDVEYFIIKHQDNFITSQNNEMVFKYIIVNPCSLDEDVNKWYEETNVWKMFKHIKRYNGDALIIHIEKDHKTLISCKGDYKTVKTKVIDFLVKEL